MTTLTANESNAAFVADMNAEAQAWMDDNAHLLPAELEGDGTPVLKPHARPESDKALHTMTLSGNDVVAERSIVGASEKVSKDSAEPSTDLGDSIADPAIAGMYFATPAEAAKADRERATHCIDDLVLARWTKSHAPTKRVRRKRQSAADKAAAIRARRNPKPATVAVEDPAPAYSPWTGRPAPYAHTATTGPLSIVDIPAPETLSASVAEVSSFPQYVVDTIGYQSGRSPYQISLRAARNSDITG